MNFKRIVITSSLVALSVVTPSLYASASEKVSIVNCLSITSAPKELVIACGDGNRFISNIHWSKWGATSTTATGTLNWNDCSPTCAAGHFHTKPLAFSATKIVAYKGARVYSELIGPKNTWTTNSTTWSLLPE